MFTETGLFVSNYSGPFGDHVARTFRGSRKVVLVPRRRLKEKFPKHYICEAFQILDANYSAAPQSVHDTWNGYATAPEISGYDAYMSQALTATTQGWYVPDLPGEGNGATPHPIMPGACQPPPLIAPVNPDAKCLVGFARCDIRLDRYGQVEYRYQHSFRDPRFPNPADVKCVVLGLWDEQLGISHLAIVGEVGVNLDTGWVSTNRAPGYITMTAFAHYRYFLLDQQFDLPLGQAVAVPQAPDAEDGQQEAAHAPFVDLHGAVPVLVSKFDNIYGQVLWTIERIITRKPYWWYHFRIMVEVIARPNYNRQPGTIHVRAVFDKINQKWRLNLRGKLKKIIRDHPHPAMPGSPHTFKVITRVSNPHILGMRLNITWKADSITTPMSPSVFRYFDTAHVPAWKRPG